MTEADYPKTPLDYPLRVHRMVPESRIAEAVAARNAEIAAEVRGLPTAGGEIVPGRGLFVSRGAVLAIVEGPH